VANASTVPAWVLRLYALRTKLLETRSALEVLPLLDSSLTRTKTTRQVLVTALEQAVWEEMKRCLPGTTKVTHIGMLHRSHNATELDNYKWLAAVAAAAGIRKES
jgi:hypothetical protein